MTTADQLVRQIQLATSYQTNKQFLKEKIQTDLLVAYNSGLFKISIELIAFLNSWDTEELILEDTYQNPIKVSRIELLKLCQQHYQLVMNTWHIEHEKIKQVRKI